MYSTSHPFQITFNWERNYWQYDMTAIVGSLADQKISDPTDLTFLRSHFRELSDEARKFLTWAAFFGETFKVTEVAAMMDQEDTISTSEEESDSLSSQNHASHLRATDNSRENSRPSTRGLQTALVEGWLVQRARDMCSFAHDRYRQAIQAEVESLPPESISKMSFRASPIPLVCF